MSDFCDTKVSSATHLLRNTSLNLAFLKKKMVSFSRTISLPSKSISVAPGDDQMQVGKQKNDTLFLSSAIIFRWDKSKLILHSQNEIPTITSIEPFNEPISAWREWRFSRPFWSQTSSWLRWRHARAVGKRQFVARDVTWVVGKRRREN